MHRTIDIKPAGESFVRIGGRDGDWWPDPQEDDTVVSPFDFVAVAGSDAVAALEHLRRTVPSKIPVLVGSAHDYGILIEQINDLDEDADEVLTEVERFDLEEWFHERVAEVQVWQDDLGVVVPPRGPWPTTPALVTELTALIDGSSDRAHDIVYLALIPVARAADTLAHLSFDLGGDHPGPCVNVALARHWEARYGAIVTTVVRNAIEFQVARPPSGRDEAERLALEHFHYSRETVQGTLQEKAASLVRSTVWRFSWD